MMGADDFLSNRALHETADNYTFFGNRTVDVLSKMLPLLGVPVGECECGGDYLDLCEEWVADKEKSNE